VERFKYLGSRPVTYVNITDTKFTNNRIRWFVHIFRINEGGIQNMTVKLKTKDGVQVHDGYNRLGMISYGRG
jgi:hypothetical protein